MLRISLSNSQIGSRNIGLAPHLVPALQQLPHPNNPDPAVLTQPEQVLIPGHDCVRSGSNCAFDDPVVVRVVLHDIQNFEWGYHGGAGNNVVERFGKGGFIQPLTAQDADRLIDDRLRNAQFDLTQDCRFDQTCGHAAPDQCGYEDVAVGDDFHYLLCCSRRSSSTQPGTSDSLQPFASACPRLRDTKPRKRWTSRCFRMSSRTSSGFRF